MEDVGRIEAIWRYPVSSIAGEPLRRAELGASGVLGDRTWGLTDAATGKAAEPERAKRWRPVASISARSGAGRPEIAVPGGPWIPCDRPEATEALRGYLGFDAELRPQADAAAPGIGPTVVPRYRRAPLHLVTTAAIRELHDLLQGASRINVRRFRPNLVVATHAGVAGFSEHGWIGRDIAVGDAVVRVSELCRRCAFPTLAQAELPADATILRAIAAHGAGSFGVLCTVVRPAAVCVGDRVTLLDDGSASSRLKTPGLLDRTGLVPKLGCG